jgi:hypothetical protein
VIVIIAWAASGPLFGYSNTWQLVVNTGTTIVTSLIVFLIQNTQNREIRIVRLSWMRHLPAANPVMIASGALPSDVPPEFRTWPTAPVCRSNVKPRAGMGWPNKSRPLYLQLRPMVQSFRMAVRGLHPPNSYA